MVATEEWVATIFLFLFVQNLCRKDVVNTLFFYNFASQICHLWLILMSDAGQ